MDLSGWSAYSMVGDVAVVAICIVVFILLGSSYVIKNKSYRIFSSIVGLVFLAAIVNIGFNLLQSRPDFMVNNAYSRGLLYLLRVVYHGLLFDVLFSYTLYAVVVSNMEHKHARVVAITSTSIFLVIVAIDVALTFTGVGFVINKETGSVEGGFNVFAIGYVLFIVFLAVLMFKIRKRVYKRVLLGFYATMALAVVVRFVQLILRQSSLTTMTFVFSILAMLYYVHINPYDTNVGTLDVKAMEDYVKNLNGQGTSFVYMSLLLPEFVGDGKALPDHITDQTRRITVDYFRNGTLFRLGNGQIVLIAAKRKKRDDEEYTQTIFTAFREQYEIYKHPYKITYGDSSENAVEASDLIGLINHVGAGIPENTIYRIGEEEVIRYKEHKYVREQIEDIYQKCDLDDPRVTVVFQPVYNVLTGGFDTAEALMRLQLDELGVVSPAVFIPIAEECGYIHVLTKIILNKTCRTIRNLSDAGYRFARISFNVSASELKDEAFCEDIGRILSDNGVSKDKIAIELTESQNEQDFIVMKDQIGKLHKEGVQFYLDDFGTGYSNMERILELPFDIIKFDRSMICDFRQNEKLEYIVRKLADVFNDMHYCVLFEGIEDGDDERRCLAMSATYLQGFKYSKPIPEAELVSFFQRSA